MSDFFEGPKNVLRWAREEIDEFQVAAINYFRENQAVKFNELDPMSGLWVYGVKIAKRPPDRFQKSAYRIVNDLRNVLDQAVWAACSTLCAPAEPKDVYFPFGENVRDFRTALAAAKGRYKNIPIELHQTLEAFKPYWPDAQDPNGNTLLRSLSVIANPNKHQLPLSVGIDLGAGVRRAVGIAQIGGRWHGNNKLELYRIRPGSYFQMEMDLIYSFVFEKTKRLQGVNAIDAIDDLIGIVDGIVSALEAETVRLLR